MQHKKKNKQTLKIKRIIILGIIALIVITILAINAYNKSIENERILNGTFYYSETVKYEFKGNGKGAMYDNDSKYEYTYKVDENKIIMDFKNEAVRDATYTFHLENDTLTLIGGEGTTGGEYMLKKENK